jgi:mycothiol S-conjugate amidase
VTQRLLAVHAHPDDESSKGAATYAYYRSRGAEVLVVSCTGGERGSILNDGLEPKAHAERDMAGLRTLEMQRAQAAMGIEHVWLGYQDSGLPENGEAVPPLSFATIPLEHSAEPLVRVIRRFKPHVLVAYDENGGYPHPDHIRAHEVAVYAMRAAADAGRYPDAGEAWSVLKLYYDRIFNLPRMRKIYETLTSEDHSVLAAEVAQILEWWADRPDQATTHIPCAEFFDVRDEALRSHASQVAPDSTFFFLPNAVQRRAWPFEDFQLVESRVETTFPEDDLFAGIPVEVSP